MRRPVLTALLLCLCAPPLLPGCVTRAKAEKALGHQQLAQVYFDEGDLGGAVTELRESIRLNPWIPETHHLLANTYFAQGFLEEAEKEFKTAVRLRESFPDAYVNWGAMLMVQERWEEAISRFETAIDDPTYRETGRAYHDLAWAQYNLGRFEEARENYERVLKVTPLFCPSIHNLAMVYEAEGDLSRAEELYIRASECDPRDLKAPMALGKLYLRLDRIDDALHYLDFVAVQDADGDLGAEAIEIIDGLPH